jgi:hypothetical protein
MTESSNDKTKRNQLALLRQYSWATQFSLFYPDYNDSRKILEDGQRIRQRIKRLYNTTPFLCKIRFMSRPSDTIENPPINLKHVYMPYWTLYTPISMNQKEIYKLLPADLQEILTIKNRQITSKHIDSAVRAIKAQKLYNTEKHIGKKANSFYIINRRNLVHLDNTF